VEPGEVEAVLGRHPQVDTARVRPEPARGLVAYVRGTADPAELRAFAAAALPRELLPEHIVPVSEFPVTANGKLDWVALAALPAPARAQPTSPEPRTWAEREIAGVWADVLGSRMHGPLGVGDDFFALGGHSLSLMRVAGLLAERFGVDVSLGELFDDPTILGMTAAVLRAQLARTDPDRAAELLSAAGGSE
jgi:hypothetical protein